MILTLTSFQIYLQNRHRSAKAWVPGILSLFLTVSVLAQQPIKSPTPNIAEDDVLRVETKLIQVDAIVKDKNGKVVTDLQKNDFEIVENGQPRAVDYSSFISVTETREQITAPADKRLMPNEVRRTFVFIANNPIVDYRYSFSGGPNSPPVVGTYSMRNRTLNASEITSEFLGKFIDEQMGNRDLVSIVDTEVSLGLLSSFTNDREILRATVKQMRRNIGKYPTARLMATRGGLDIQELIQQNLAVLETARSAVDQLKKVPGRKIVVMISRALLYNTRLHGTQVIKDRLNELIAQANQAQVTFYYVSPTQLEEMENALDRVSDGGVQELAEKTGGRSIYHTNDASGAFKEILKENDGYYQLAYDPGETLDSRPHNITVRVRRNGLSVQARSTVYKTTVISKTDDAKENLLRLLRSPFGSNGVKITLSSVYQPLNKKSGRITTSLKIDPKTVEPTIAADNLRYLKMDLAIQVTGPDNKLVRQEIKNFTLKISDESWNKIQTEGLIYQFDTDTVQNGYYQVNVAACIVDSKQCGSASRFINAVQSKNN
jgi:VWFA-related protein